MSWQSSMEGGATTTFWKRRSKAPSFSMWRRYSSRVVAPMIWISPRDRAGLNILAASSEPLALPAPTRVCSSSMKTITSLADSSSCIKVFSRSSNCPRYFVPATRAPRSRASSRWPCNTRGTSRLTIRVASPSTMAVLPTPGSPISTGLFFFRLAKICATRLISCSRPMTGSRALSFARAVISRLKWSSVGVSDFLAWRPARVLRPVLTSRAVTRFLMLV